MSTIQPTINQGSGAAKPVFAHVPIEAALDFTRLDRTVDRYQLLLLAKRVGKEGGFTPRMLQLLEYYLAYTTAVDWQEGARPIVFQSLARTAMDLGVGERQIQKLEKKLFGVGAIAWNDSGNHKRFGKRCARSGRLVFAYGVDLTPLAYLEEQLQAKLHEKQLYAEAWRATKREISQLRRQIRSLLSLRREQGADATELEHFEQSYEKIAMELRSHIDLARLRSLRQEHVRLEQTLFDALLEANASVQAKESTPVPMAPPTQKGSRSHVQKVAHQEQITPIKKEGRRWPSQTRGYAVPEVQKAIGSEAITRLVSYHHQATAQCPTRSTSPVPSSAVSSKRRELGRSDWLPSLQCDSSHVQPIPESGTC